MKRKLLTLALSCILSFTILKGVAAEIPDKTVVIGNKGYSYKYANEEANRLEIVQALKNNKGKIYIKFGGRWFNNSNNIIDSSILPEIEYKDKNSTVTYLKSDGEIKETKETKETNNEEEVINFKDPNLEEAIREKINKTSGDILKSDVLNIQELFIGYQDIESIDGLENLKNLKTLSLGENQIADISSLQGLAQLIELRLEHNQITDISPLEGLTQLKYLFLDDNQIIDISSLEGITQLQTLQLRDNQISDYSPVESYYENIVHKDFELLSQVDENTEEFVITVIDGSPENYYKENPKNDWMKEEKQIMLKKVYDIPVDKEYFEITFNKELGPNILNYFFSIWDRSEGSTPWYHILSKLDENGKRTKVRIILEEKLKPDTDYFLIVNSGFKCIDGSKLENKIVLPFHTAKE